MLLIRFIKKLLNPNDATVSSKTFIAILFSIQIVIAGYIDMFWKLTMTEYIFYGILGAALTLFGYNTVLSNKKITSEQVPTEVHVENTKNVNVEEGNVTLGSRGNVENSPKQNEIIG